MVRPASHTSTPDPLPRLSVIIPARDEEHYLAAAMESVAGQRYPLERLECVIVDNGSSDATAAVAAEFARDCPKLAMSIQTEPIPGVGRAKNRGAESAGGEVLIFLDADSRMDPSLAQDVAAAWSAGHPAGSIRIEADSRHPVDRGFFALMEVGKVMFGIRSQMMYCDAALFRMVGGFDPSLQLAEDLEFLKRVKARVRQDGGGKVCHVRSSGIKTSPRRLRRLPFHLAMIPMFARWALAFMGVARDRRY
jgi:glycosyltransferase involved in cell wall biosynthesis